ncbi:hypothetical protein MJH12_11505, partial [bacterium]|nr:hypothetical protein [bacterium]
YYNDFKLSWTNSKLADEGNDLWNNKKDHQAFHKYWKWLERTNLDLSNDKTSLIMSRIISFLNENEMDDIGFKVFSNSQKLNLRVKLAPKLKEEYSIRTSKIKHKEKELQQGALKHLDKYIQYKTENHPTYLIKIGQKYWLAGHHKVANKFITAGVTRLVNYSKESLKYTVDYIDPVIRLIDIDKCSEASYIFYRLATNNYVLDRYKIKVDNCTRKSKALFDLVLAIKSNPTDSIKFENLGYEDFNDAAKFLIKANLYQEAIKLAVHEDTSNNRCGRTKQQELVDLFSYLGKADLSRTLKSSITNPINLNRVITITSHSTSEILEMVKAGYTQTNLFDVLSALQKDAVSHYRKDQYRWKAVSNMDNILAIYLIFKEYDKAMSLSTKYTEDFDRYERLNTIVKTLSQNHRFIKAMDIIKQISHSSYFYGEAIGDLAVELYRKGDIERALTLIATIPDGRLIREGAFGKISKVSINLRNYKYAIDFAYKSTEIDHKTKIEEALFKILPNCNSSQQLEILSHTLTGISSIVNHNFHSKSKVQMVLGKHYVKVGKIEKGLSLIEDGLCGFPDIENIVEIDLFLRKWKLNFKNQSKLLKTALNFEPKYSIRKPRRKLYTLKVSGLRDGLFFHLACKLCKVQVIKNLRRISR